jgi:predicted nucleotidyltransferase
MRWRPALPDGVLELRADELAIVRQILQHRVPSLEVWAFGSRVNGKAKPYSDLDLAVISVEPLTMKVLAALVDDFSESDLPFKVDVIDWASTQETFRALIAQEKTVLLAGSQQQPTKSG